MLTERRQVRVFLADDSIAIRLRVAELMQSLGMAVVGEGATPQACIEAILATLPDVVVLDVQLEGGVGLQVLNAVSAAAPGIRFIVFSNAGAAGYRGAYLDAGALAFLDKSRDYQLLGPWVQRAAAGITQP